MKGLQSGQASERGPTILVVDDELPIIRFCAAFLQRAGMTVLTAEGSSEALKICTHHPGPIDLLIADLVLPPPAFQLASAENQFPHVNGHELALRASLIRKDLRIILMSGNPDQELVSHGIKRGTFPFLAKPFDADHLMTLVQHVLRQPMPTCESRPEPTSLSEPEWFG